MASFDRRLLPVQPGSSTSGADQVTSQVISPAEMPYEILYDILELAMRPEFVVDFAFEPLQIDIAHDMCTLNPGSGDNNHAQKILKKHWKNLRLVCRTWREIVDKIKAYNWVINVDGSEGPLHPFHYDSKIVKGDLSLNAPPLDTHQCSRLNVSLKGNKDPRMSIRYSHPISTLSISFSSFVSKWDPEVTGSIASLKCIVSFPECLRALCLHVREFHPSNDLVQDFRSRFISLTTLSLYLENTPIFQVPLEIPTLISLFLSFPIQDASDSQADMKWTFPAMRNLSISADHGWSNRPSHYKAPALLKLIRDHFNQLQALRLSPMITEIGDQSSPLSW
ncbi:hypothetical protein CPB86DRAFT_821095, partial [Serendipita vermifera]